MTLETLPMILLFTATGLLIAGILAAHVASVLWVGRDARRRGIPRPGILMLITALQFPWVVLMYALVTRLMDQRDEAAALSCTGAGHAS